MQKFTQIRIRVGRVCVQIQFKTTKQRRITEHYYQSQTSHRARLLAARLYTAPVWRAAAGVKYFLPTTCDDVTEFHENEMVGSLHACGLLSLDIERISAMIMN